MRMIYVSHPYGGLKENEESADAITGKLAKIFPDMVFVSPIHAVRSDYKMTPYKQGLLQTIEILKRSDAIFMSPGWRKSTGCITEEKYARHRKIAILHNGAEVMDWYWHRIKNFQEKIIRRF